MAGQWFGLGRRCSLGLAGCPRFRVTVPAGFGLFAPALLIAGHPLTNNTPMSTDSGIERRKRRIELNTTGPADRFWLVAANLFATASILQLLGVVLIWRLRFEEFRKFDLGPAQLAFSVIQTAFPISLSLGAWHRTRWGCKPERFVEDQQPDVPLVGRTAAGVGFVICLILLFAIVAAALVQLEWSGADLRHLLP